MSNYLGAASNADIDKIAGLQSSASTIDGHIGDTAVHFTKEDIATPADSLSVQDVVDVQNLSGVNTGDQDLTHNHDGVYEAYDPTILKDADIGVNVEAYDPTILKDADIGVNVEAYDPTILKDVDIGVNVEAYDPTILKDADIGVNVEAYDPTILKDADIGVNVEAYDPTILKDADIGVNVEAYDPTILKSDVTAGGTLVANIVKITQAEYDALTPVDTTVYIIVD